jgi:hypothetical protein
MIFGCHRLPVIREVAAIFSHRDSSHLSVDIAPFQDLARIEVSPT